jgi:hypothetical protein
MNLILKAPHSLPVSDINMVQLFQITIGPPEGEPEVMTPENRPLLILRSDYASMAAEKATELLKRYPGYFNFPAPMYEAEVMFTPYSNAQNGTDFCKLVCMELLKKQHKMAQKAVNVSLQWIKSNRGRFWAIDSTSEISSMFWPQEINLWGENMSELMLIIMKALKTNGQVDGLCTGCKFVLIIFILYADCEILKCQVWIIALALIRNQTFRPLHRHSKMLALIQITCKSSSHTETMQLWRIYRL